MPDRLPHHRRSPRTQTWRPRGGFGDSDAGRGVDPAGHRVRGVHRSPRHPRFRRQLSAVRQSRRGGRGHTDRRPAVFDRTGLRLHRAGLERSGRPRRPRDLRPDGNRISGHGGMVAGLRHPHRGLGRRDRSARVLRQRPVGRAGAALLAPRRSRVGRRAVLGEARRVVRLAPGVRVGHLRASRTRRLRGVDGPADPLDGSGRAGRSAERRQFVAAVVRAMAGPLAGRGCDRAGGLGVGGPVLRLFGSQRRRILVGADVRHRFGDVAERRFATLGGVD